MKESIYIKNLGPIKAIFIEDVKPFTILVGESGSGKSTLMKAMALFRWIYKMYNIRSYLKHSKISKSPFRFRMEKLMTNCGFEEFLKSDTEIVYTATVEGRSYEIAYRSGKLSNRNMEINKADIYFNKISFLSETRNIIPLWANKGASLTGTYLGFYFHEVYGDFDLAADDIKELNLPFLDLNFKVKKAQGRKKYLIGSTKDNSYEIDYKNSSSGIQNTVPIELIMEYFSKKFKFEDAFSRSVLTYLSNTDKLTEFKPIQNLSDIHKKIYVHIEEPELSLYPDAQCQLLNNIINRCFISNRNEIELFMSTHSPYIINHLNLLIKAFDKNKLVDNAKYNYDDLDVFQVAEGKIFDLKIQNERLINTNLLSEVINSMYDQYATL